MKIYLGGYCNALMHESNGYRLAMFQPMANWPDDMMTSSNGNMSRVTIPFAENSPVTGEFPAQRPVTRSFDVLFDLRLNKRLNKQSRGWWFEMPSHLLRRHCNELLNFQWLSISLTHISVAKPWWVKCLQHLVETWDECCQHDAHDIYM